MAIQWGSWVGPNSSERFRVGVELSLSGTTITIKYYVASQGRATGDNAILTRTGAKTGTKSFTFNAGTSGATMLVDTQTFTGTRGKAYTFGAKANKFYIGDSYTPSVSDSITVPVIVPATPSKPAQVSVTSTSVNVKTSAPASNGGALLDYQWQIAPSSSFGSGTRTMTVPADVVSTVSYPTCSFTGNEPNATYYVRVRARNAAGYSAWSSTLTVKTAPQTPTAPSGLNVSRSSDKLHNLSWTLNTSPTRPYDSIIIQRSDSIGTDWRTVATVSGTVTQFADMTTIAGPRYRWRIQSKNAAGSSDWATSAEFDTTPTSPIKCSAEKVGANIVVSWEMPKNLLQPSIEVWEQQGSGAWQLIATVPTGANGSYTHVSPSTSVTHTYRVRSKTVSPVLYSTGYATSQVVQLASVPSAPTIYGFSAAIDRSNASSVSLSWKHNPTDSAAQASYQIRARISPSTTWVEHSAVTWSGQSSGLETTLTRLGMTNIANGQILEWQVRTWGVHPTASSWSATSTVVFSATPTVTISQPSDLLTIPRLTLEWAYYQEQGSAQGQWQAELFDADNVAVESLNGSGAQTSVAFAKLLTERRSWSVRVRALSGAGLWSAWDTRTFTTDYPEPPTPQVSGTWQSDSGSMEVSVYNPTPPSDSYTVVNQFINPGFAGHGSIKGEVRRNAYLRPFMNSLDGLTSVAGASLAVVGGVVEVQAMADGEGVALGGNLSSLPSGVEYTAAIDVTGVAGDPVTWRLTASGAGVATVYGENEVANGETVRLVVTFSPTTSAAVALNVTKQNKPGGGAVARISRPVVESGPQAGDYFDGSTIPNDPDLSCNWAGTANNSVSYTRAWVPTLVSDLVWPGRNRAIQSSQWAHSGTTSLRVMPGESANVWAGPESGTWTLVAMCRVTGTVEVDDAESRAIIFRYGNGAVQAIGQAPNEVGVHVVRVVGENLPQFVQLTGQDGSEVFWDSLTVIEGEDLETMPFDGVRQGYTTPDGYAVTYAWDGTADSSTSTASFSPAPDAETNSIYRQVNEGEWVLIAEGIPANGVYIDPIPTLAGINRYKAIATTQDTGAAESTPAEIDVSDPGWIYLNFGPSFSKFVRWYGNTKLSGSTSRERVLHQFAGRKKPVPFFGAALEQKVSITGRLTDDSSNLYEVEDAIREAEILCARDPKGRRIFAVAGALSHQWEGPNICQVSIEVEEVDYDE